MKVPKVLTPVDIFRPYHMGLIRRRNPARKPVKRRPDTTDLPFVSLILPPRKKSADLGSSRCEVDIKRVYDAVIRPGNLSNTCLILPTCRLFRLSFLSHQLLQT